MGPLFLLGLASQQAQWLTARQQVIATNVANANTPGFQALDLKPFSEVMERTRVSMAATDVNHIAPPGNEATASARKTADGWETTLSGNSVSLEQQMLKAGEVHRALALNTSIVKAFDRMILSSVK